MVAYQVCNCNFDRKWLFVFSFNLIKELIRRILVADECQKFGSKGLNLATTKSKLNERAVPAHTLKLRSCCWLPRGGFDRACAGRIYLSDSTIAVRIFSRQRWKSEFIVHEVVWVKFVTPCLINSAGLLDLLSSESWLWFKIAPSADSSKESSFGESLEFSCAQPWRLEATGKSHPPKPKADKFLQQ